VGDSTTIGVWRSIHLIFSTSQGAAQRSGSPNSTPNSQLLRRRSRISYQDLASGRKANAKASMHRWNGAQRRVECFVRFVPRGVELQLFSDGSSLMRRVFASGEEAVAFAEEMTKDFDHHHRRDLI